MLRCCLFILIWLPCTFAMAQQTDDWEQELDAMAVMEDEEEPDWEAVYEVMSDLTANKINLNSASREDLEQLPFLSSQQVEDIMDYLYHYGPMRSLGELALLEGLDDERRRLLSQVVYLGEPETKSSPQLKNAFKYGHHEAVLTAHVPFYTRHGDENGYLGYKFKHSLRYQFNYGQHLKVGFLGAQDSGEPFFANKNKWGYDHYSYYLVMKQWGRLKALALGRYRLRYGMGLALNNDFTLGKLGALATLQSPSNTLRAHSSRMESNYLQGAAATIQLWRHIDLSAFVSYRSLDATLTSDGGGIATLLTSGYHRTQSELERKHNVQELLWGGHLQWRQGGWHAGMSFIRSSFSKPLEPDKSKAYRQYAAEGKTFWNASIDYGYTHHRFTLAGETALNDRKAVATINNLSFLATGNLTLMLLQRFYSYRYTALHGRSFSDGGAVQNESGIFFGLKWQPSRRWQLSAYTDYAYHPWAKYLISQSSHAWDQLLMVNYQHKAWQLNMRYRMRIRQRDDADKVRLVDRTEHRGRMMLTLQRGQWTWKTQADLVVARVPVGQEEQSDAYGGSETTPAGATKGGMESSVGFMLSEHLTWRHQRWMLHSDLGYFHTDSYDSRVYAYERGMRYAFSFPMFYGHGLRATLLAQCRVTSQWTLLARMGYTHYFDRNKIGSGLQQIDSNHMSALEIQAIWKM